MKVPFSVNTQNNPKPPPATAAAAYEPKSVLELCGSPISNQKPLILVDPQLVDWDSFSELGLHDHHDPNSVSKPTIHQLNSHPLTQIIPTDQYSNQLLQTDFGSLSDIPLIHDNSYSINSFDSFTSFDGYVNELIQLAESIDTNSLQLGNVLLSRLNQTLSSPAGKPLQRIAFYFKEALQCLLTESTRPSRHPTTSSEIIQTIKAQKIFSTISPIPMFASFTANQAVLDVMDNSTSVHVIDFDIGLGGHWASFMKDLASRATPPPALRISAVVCEQYGVESRLIRESLVQFSRELNIDRFVIDFISVRTFEYLSFRSIKFTDGEKVAVLLSPEIFHRVGTEFLNDLPQVSPYVVVHVGIQGGLDSGSSSSCRQAVIDGIELYSALLESLEAAESDGGGDWVQMIEAFVVFPMIVEAAGRRGIGSREALAAAGLREAGLSQLAELQAECLVRRGRVEGFHVVKQQAEMLLCWHDRPIVATSAWKY
ncbi:hypothetical protein ABFS82_08G074100 [Erythranthe guttata]|uniref:Uncharacterized protein n=1 Tax=Erythranthe guttata TaxID=4155 RepID=A0A022S0C4_ERYGU|nr:PREDICTED: scarecrow-like protein 15 [Erythranthe guttata]EYU44670.1 hypothetical protein MIMGU_mgv1a026210mg [Erythranthe guttata]|eukprot:XP_012855976.1 PREDICTED: scarecrow-like protein 15 [Erythranthe guttata]